MGLFLVPTAFRSYIKVNTDDGESIQWGGQLRLQRDQSVELATGEDLNKLDGELTLMLVEDEGKEEEKNKPIGWMCYYKKSKDSWTNISHKAFYSMQIRIPRRQFGPLLTALSQGRLPSLILLDVEGLTSVSPDGSHKKWDNKNSPELQITSIEFITSLIAGDQLIGGHHPGNFFDKRLNKVIFCLWVIIVLQLIVMWRGH